MNKVILVGRLCQDPELKYVGEKNIPTTKFTLAVNRNYKNSHGDLEADFIKCELWRRQAEVFCQYMTKGRLIYLEGELKIDNYISSSGENRKSIVVSTTVFKFLDSKSKSTSDGKVFNSDAVFDSEEIINDTISENEIPF